jgi:hypothetical protein
MENYTLHRYIPYTFALPKRNYYQMAELVYAFSELLKS